MNQYHVKKHYPNSLLQITTVDYMSLSDFIEKYVSSKSIELISNGFGTLFWLLLGNNWKQINSTLISFEHLHLGNKHYEVINYLIKNGYTYTGTGMDNTGFDYLYKKMV